jgi:riboflavin synthase
MFTGLISDIGKIINIYPNQEGKIFTILAHKTALEVIIGDSVAINGTCLTAFEISHEQFKVQAVHITLQKTNLSKLNTGDAVNLELAVKATDRLGGHLVQGHVNGIGTLFALKAVGNNYEIEIMIPSYLHHYLIGEGSIAIDGISLTIARVMNQSIIVSIIPHTWHATTLHAKKIGDTVNIEIDIIAKYVEQFLQKREKKEAITKDWLFEHGY